MLTTGRMIWVVWGVFAAAALGVIVALAVGRNEPALGEPLDLESPAPAVTLEPTPDGSTAGQTAPSTPSVTPSPTTPTATPPPSRTTTVVPQQPVLVPDEDDNGDDDNGDDDNGDDDDGDDEDDDDEDDGDDDD